MWESLTALRDQLLGKRGLAIDNEIFRFHYRYTLMILAVFAFVVTSKQYLGDPIECFSYGKDVPAKALNLYCWVQTTFILPKALTKKVGVDVIAKGVDTHFPEDDKIYLKYYQWVGLFLIFQATMFYCTRYLWKALEGGKVEGLHDKDKTKVADYLFRTRKQHKGYFPKFVLCEVLNLLNVILQIYFVDNFLGGEFRQYGPNVVQFLRLEQEDRVDPMIKVFPRITKCTFHRFGPSGNIQKQDVFCVLPLNILNEKMFVFLWFWFVVLGLFSGLVVVYRIFQLLLPPLRKKTLKWSYKSLFFEDVIFEQNLGFLLLLDRLAKNSESLDFQEMLNLLADKLRGDKSGKGKFEPDEQRLLEQNPQIEMTNFKNERSNSVAGF